jgi:High potential iron-sulfur protein
VKEITMQTPNVTRRRFVQFASLSAASLVVLGNANAAEPAKAAAEADLPKLELTNPTAKALGYVEDTKKADQAKYKNHTAEQKCMNCRFMKGDPKKPRMGCTLFAGKSVASQGWCASWVKPA